MAQYRFDHWTTDNGLPQNSVRDIVQTRDGYLWFTTFDGLVRFDGVRFTVFNKSNSPGLISNRFVDLFEDRRGDLWATTETGEVVRRHGGRFTTYPRLQSLQSNNNPWLDDDGQGNVAYHYGQLIFDENGKAYTNVKVTAYRWSEDRFQPAKELNSNFSTPALTLDEATKWTFLKLIGGEFWTFTTKRVIHLMKDRAPQFYSERNGLPGGQPGLLWGKERFPQAVSRDAAGRLWLTNLQSMQSRLLSQQTPEGFVIHIGYADNEGNYWFGTYNNGLFRARPLAVTPYGRAQGMNFGEIYPLLEGRDGSLWIGAYGEGIFRLKDGTFTQFPVSTNKTLDWINGLSSSLYEDRAGRLWVNGAWQLIEGRYVRAPWAKALYYPRYINPWTMCEDRAGDYWFGTDFGVFRYQNGTLTHFTTQDGLAGNDTKVIIEDGQGGLWLGSYGGLTYYKDGKFTAWTEKEGLPGNTVRALKLDPDGTLWIGTYDSGLGRFKDGRFTRYTVKDGLFDNGVFQILEDDYGWFWMSCNRGIYRVRKGELIDFAAGRVKALNSLAYNKSDGMPSSECNGGRWPAGVKTRDGKLWFPTMEGLAVIDPAAVKANTQPPPVVIEGMRINNQPAALEGGHSAIGNPLSAIRIEPGLDNFEIEYTALSFINSENMRFKYKLEGANQDWVDAGTRRTAYYSHVSPGNYTFKVIAANADGVWNEAGASVRLTIAPAYWQTWWFTTLMAMGAVGVIAAAWAYRVRQLWRAQIAQQNFSRQLIESQEHERKRIAAELHDSLGQNLLIVKNWALVGLNAQAAGNSTHEHLTEISETTSLALDEVREIAHNLRPYQLERLGLTNTIEFMLHQVKTSSDIEFTVELENVDGLLAPESEINLYRIVQEVINNVIKHSNATEAWLAVKRTAVGIEIICRDNGRGFDPVAAARSRASGMGLSGLSERVRILGGHNTIDSAPGAGATITITIDAAQQ
jgi:signal transduction histidine kinase/ligand-binding sensor domain-containing protein